MGDTALSAGERAAEIVRKIISKGARRDASEFYPSPVYREVPLVIWEEESHAFVIGEVPKDIYPVVVAHLKKGAGLDLATNKSSQVGTFMYKHNSGNLKLLVETTPVMEGEAMNVTLTQL